MPRSLSQLAKAAATHQSNTSTKGIDTEKFEPVCVCGHRENKHSPRIGGSWSLERREVKAKGILVQTLEGCRGEPRRRGSEDPVRSRQENPEDPDLPIALIEYVTTCPCREFRPVLEVFAPKNRFGQQRPTVGRTRQRETDPMKHALMVGLKAQRTHVSNLMEIKKMREVERPESVIEQRIDELYDERIRVLDTWRCMEDGCEDTDALPYYVDLDDRSELRCTEHAPVYA